jgi:hypothetical protein
VTLAEQIIDHGPYRGGDQLPIEVQTAGDDDLNALRDDLLELRALRIPAATVKTFRIDLNFWDDTAALRCPHCDTRLPLADGDNPFDLLLRIGEHQEVCA